MPQANLWICLGWYCESSEWYIWSCTHPLTCWIKFAPLTKTCLIALAKQIILCVFFWNGILQSLFPFSCFNITFFCVLVWLFFSLFLSSSPNHLVLGKLLFSIPNKTQTLPEKMFGTKAVLYHHRPWTVKAMQVQLIFSHVNIKFVLSPGFSCCLLCPYLLVLSYCTSCGLRTNLLGACTVSCRKVSSRMGLIL